MNWFGVHLTLMIGEHALRHAPHTMVEALHSVEVTQGDNGPSGFQLTFQIGRSSAMDLVDYRVLRSPLIKPFNRVALIVRFAFRPQVLMDGIITNIQMSPSEEPGQSRLVVTGEDISLLMDLEERRQTYSDVKNKEPIVREILNRYQQYFVNIVDINVSPCPGEESDNFNQIMSDRAFLYELARELGFIFYVAPGVAPSSNRPYFGPKQRSGEIQHALSFNMGPHSNVDSISFTYDGEKAIKVGGAIKTDQDGESEYEFIRPIESHTLVPVMAGQNPAYSDMARRRQSFISFPVSSIDAANTRAQAMVNQSSEEVVTAQGELDTLRYGRLLQAHAKVGLRGVGQTFDGDYYVSSVTHSIQVGKYKQRFSLSREGVGALSCRVRP